jgi:Orsellinic acid/F9775 biosynthesis cluster protein D
MEVEEEEKASEIMSDVGMDVLNPIPIRVDGLYNLVVCTDCGIGLPYEWVSGHFRHQHRIKKSMEELNKVLDLEQDTMTLEEAMDWIKSIWVARAVQGIPVHEGLKCTKCMYCVKETQGTRNHFTQKHKGLKMKDYTEKCKVQCIFKGILKKYIQIEEPEGMEMDVQGDSDWITAVNQEFGESIANIKVASGRHRSNLRLMNAFIAKTRWDSLVENMDMEVIVKMAAMPMVNRNLHKVILCGRRYIHKVCKDLDQGSIIVKRLLMSGG